MTETPTEPQTALPAAAEPTTPAFPAAAQEASTLPPDPVAYDSPRAVRARAKGLQAPYIAGGNDPDPAAGLAEERHYGRLLVGMAVAIVASGFVIGTIIALFAPAAGT